MNRRDLLLLRTTPKARVVELSCQRLYMQYLDLRRTAAATAQDIRQDYWLGEPEPEYAGRDAQELFHDIASQLREADVFRITGRDWLCDEELVKEVERLTSDFAARGGRVEVIGATHPS